MRTISPELEAILRSRFQASGSGCVARLEVDSVVPPVGPFLNASSARSKIWQVSYSGGALGGTPAGWNAPGFDDGGWEDPDTTTEIQTIVAVPPSLQLYPHDAVTDLHVQGLVWLARIPFTLGSLPTAATMYVGFDDSADFYINGTLVHSVGGDGGGYFNTTPIDVSGAPFVVGENVLAVRVVNWSGGAHWIGNPTWVEYRLFTDVVPVGYAETYAPRRANLNRNLRMGPDQLTVELANEDIALGFGPTSIFPTNSRCRLYQWYGDPEDAVLTFTGVIDKVDDSRDPLTTVLTCRSLAGPILVDPTFSTTAPQSADEAGAVRTEDNGVYLAREVDYVVADRLTRAGWPADHIDIADTTFVLDEFIVDDGACEWDTLARLAAFVGYTLWDDEDGWIHFATIGARASVDNTLVADYEYEIGAA